MLTIRLDQLAALQKAAEQKFLRKARAHIEQAWPDWAAQAGEDLAAGIDGLVQRAVQNGIADQDDLLDFLDLGGTYGADFLECFPEAQAQLEAAEPAEGALKVAALEEVLEACLEREDEARQPAETAADVQG